MNCLNCGTDNPERAKFCIECGSPLQRQCPSCDFENLARAKFCAECGASLESVPTSDASTPEPTFPITPESEREPASYTTPHLAEKILTSRSALEGERKQVTVLFCDLRNSTAIAEKIGAEAMHGLLSRFFELAMDEVHRYEGTVNQLLGDGFMALFGAPISHEDHARRAVLAALDLQRSLRDHHEELGGQHGVDLAFRMGLNTGMVVVGSVGNDLRLDYTAIGDTTNLAARLEQIAEPGTVLVSENTSRLIQGYVRLEALEPVEVKGKAEPVPIHKVLGTIPRRSPIVSRSERTLSQFVGRERELATLEELFAQVEAGNGQVVGVVADAGGGKSRLLYEFRQRLQDKHVTYLEGRCLSYGSSIPYHPIIDVLRNNCDVTESDEPETIVEKVRLALQEVGMNPDDSAPYLLQLLGVKEGTESIAQLTPEAIRTRTFDTLRQMSLNGAQRRPLVFEVEDVHWWDNTSEAYLSELVESLPGASIMLITTYRPGTRPSWLEKSYATQISLHSLASQDALTIVHSSQPTVLSDQMVQTVVEKAEGNPFFLEELARAVAEVGDQSSDVVVPDTIQGVLSARIDRLPEIHKRLLQTASVIGRAFSLRLLERIWEGFDSLSQLLDDLKRQEFLFERTGTEEITYVFRHALTENVAYDSLLTTRRQALHTAVGKALETLYENRLEDAYDRLAYHYARTDNAVKAVEYLTLMAERATRAYAHADAVNLLQEALVHAEQLAGEKRDRCCVDVAIRQADPLFYLGRRQELIDLLLGYQERLKRLQESSLAGPFYLWLGYTYSFLGQRKQAVQTLHHALEEATRCSDEITMGQAYGALGTEYLFLGQLSQAIMHSRQSIRLLETTREPIGMGRAYQVLGYSCFFSGDCTGALEVAEHAHTLGVMTGDQRCQTHALTLSGQCYTIQGEWDSAIEALQHALVCSPDAFETAITIGFLGYAYLEKGDLTEALSILEDAVEQANQYRSRQVQSWFKAYLGEAYRMDGQIDRARNLARQTVQLAADIQHPWGVASAQRTLGRIASTSDRLTEAEHSLKNALETFSSLEARYELAHTHLDLASLAHTQGTQDIAKTHLSTAYAWFKKLQVSRWMERTEQLAQEYGLRLTEVEIEEVAAEGLS